MAGSSKSVASIALILLSLNLIFFSTVSSDTVATSPGSAPPRECPELGFCLNILGGRFIGNPSNDCCPILGGLAQFEAITCICDILRSSVVGIPIDVDLALITIFGLCGRDTNGLICN